MSPTEFFEKATAGSLVRYDRNNCMSVRVTMVSKIEQFAIGRDTRLHRRIFLYLKDGMLKEGISGSFDRVELSR